MPSVTGFTANRMLQIENETVVDGEIVGGELILIRRDGIEINAGSVIGPEGPAGATSIEIVTSGTRPAGLGPGDEGLFIYETDTNMMFSWDGSTWIYRGGKVICTSGTRPASPPAGLEIYETDTGRFMIRSPLGAWIRTGYTKAAGRTGVSLTDTQSLPDGTPAAFTNWTELYDSDGFFSSGATVTIPAGLSGIYACLATCDAPTGPYTRNFLELNIGAVVMRSGSVNEDYMSLSPTMFISAGTSIGLSGFQISGASRNWAAALELVMIHHLPE